VLVDPGWLDPVARDITLAAQASGAWRVTDRLTGEALGTLDRPLPVRVPAGAFRLLDVAGR
jgi:hypothetical protein